MKSKNYYIERAAYLRRLAKDSQTEALRRSCLKEADECDALAKEAAKAEVETGQE